MSSAGGNKARQATRKAASDNAELLYLPNHQTHLASHQHMVAVDALSFE
jgi:hypothetical protein